MISRSVEPYSVAMLGFSEFERAALLSYFRFAPMGKPNYVQVAKVDGCDFIVADADHMSAVKVVHEAGRYHDTVFVGGARAPNEAVAWLPRPMDPMRAVRELDSLVHRRHAVAPELDLAVAMGADVERQFWDAVTQSDPSTLDAEYTLDEPSGPDVLVADDSAIARRFLEMRLRRLGYRVHLADSVEGVLDLLECQPFKLIFLDVVLGPATGPDGLAICQQIKQDPRLQGEQAPKVVLVTGLTGAVYRVRGELAGCDAYLTKPLYEREFMDTLQRLDPPPLPPLPRIRSFTSV